MVGVSLALCMFCLLFLGTFWSSSFSFQWVYCVQQGSIKYLDKSAVYNYSKPTQEINKCTMEIIIFFVLLKLKIKLLNPCAKRMLNLKTKT